MAPDFAFGSPLEPFTTTDGTVTLRPFAVRDLSVVEAAARDELIPKDQHGASGLTVCRRTWCRSLVFDLRCWCAPTGQSDEACFANRSPSPGRIS